MEMLAIMGLTGGFAAHGKPIMANGANLFFDKGSFEEIGGYSNSNNPSGDDVFTMLSFNEKWSASVRFVKHYESAVLTKPEATFSSFGNNESVGSPNEAVIQAYLLKPRPSSLIWQI